MNATTAQIDYIRTLQAKNADVTLPAREDWAAQPGNAYTVDEMVRDEIQKIRNGETSFVAGQYATLREARTVSKAAAAEYPERRNPEHRAHRKAAIEVEAAAEKTLRLAVEDRRWAQVQEGIAAITIDPTTLSKDEASRIIDLLK